MIYLGVDFGLICALHGPLESTFVSFSTFGKLSTIISPNTLQPTLSFLYSGTVVLTCWIFCYFPTDPRGTVLLGFLSVSLSCPDWMNSLVLSSSSPILLCYHCY